MHQNYHVTSSTLARQLLSSEPDFILVAPHPWDDQDLDPTPRWQRTDREQRRLLRLRKLAAI